MQKKVKIHTEYIKLGQLLKMVGEIDNGAEAKSFLEEVDVFINEEHDQRRGRKIYPGYKVTVKGTEYIIESELDD